VTLGTAGVFDVLYITTLVAYTFHLSSMWKYNYPSLVKIHPFCTVIFKPNSSLLGISNIESYYYNNAVYIGVFRFVLKMLIYDFNHAEVFTP